MTARRTAREWIALLLFPPRCAACGEVVPIGLSLCTGCAARLAAALQGQALCQRCGKPLPSCICRNGPFCFTRCLSVLPYGEETRRLFERLKSGDADTAAQLAMMMAGRWQQSGLPAPGAVAFVPAKPGRYNQARALAEPVGAALGVKVLDNALIRHQNSRVQHTLSLAERRENAAASYGLGEGILIPERVLLIDDIITTGSTLSSCARLLLQAGAREVICLTAATTPLDNREGPARS